MTARYRCGSRMVVGVVFGDHPGDRGQVVGFNVVKDVRLWPRNVRPPLRAMPHRVDYVERVQQVAVAGLLSSAAIGAGAATRLFRAAEARGVVLPRDSGGIETIGDRLVSARTVVWERIRARMYAVVVLNAAFDIDRIHRCVWIVAAPRPVSRVVDQTQRRLSGLPQP